MDDVNIQNVLGKQGEVAIAFNTFLNAMYRGNEETVSPSNLKNVISRYNEQFEGDEQQDSHEFMNCLLD